MTSNPALEEVVFCFIFASYFLMTRFLPSIMEVDICDPSI